MARKIVVTSGKGGVGKTTLAVYLSIQLAKKGQRVVLCDADFGLNNVDVTAGVEGLATYDVVDVIEGRCRAKQALVQHPKFPNLYLLSSTRATPERYVSPQSIKVVLDALSPSFDFILIDCPAGIDEGFHRAVATADEALVVTTPHISALRDADKVVTVLKSYALRTIALVVNMVRGDRLVAGGCLSPAEIEKLIKIPLIGVIPEEDDVYRADLSCVHPAFKALAVAVLTGKKKLYDPTRKYSGFFGGVRRVLKERL